MKQTAVEWLMQTLEQNNIIDLDCIDSDKYYTIIEQAKAMEKEQIIDFGEFIIDELEPMAQNREWVEERYNYFKSE